MQKAFKTHYIVFLAEDVPYNNTVVQVDIKASTERRLIGKTFLKSQKAFFLNIWQ